jgi:Ni,Fe-hydrogenase maturation factor
VKDLLDAFYIQGGAREVILYAITIDPLQSISLDLSAAVKAAADEAVHRILEELKSEVRIAPQVQGAFA